MRLVVFGGWGQLGSDLAVVAEGRHELIRPRHADADVVDPDAVGEVIARERPEVVLDLAALHQVDRCEREPERAFAVNAIGALNIARATSSAGARCVYISTDYVFGGGQVAGYSEDDPIGPLNVYGTSKGAGEALVRAACPDSLVIRGSALFGHAGSSGKGGNFVETMLAKARAGEPFTVVDDLTFAPTATRDMAERIVMLLERHVPPGIYHAANLGHCTWFEFARRIVELAGLSAEITPRSSDPVGVRRPINSVLLDTRGAALGLPEARRWDDALAWYLASRSSPADPAVNRGR